MAHIVIVDDSLANLKIYAKLAGQIGSGEEIRVFSDPQEALVSLRESPPDLVITDYKMPTMTGSELTRLIRRLPACLDVPIVVVTAYNDRDFRIEALNSGATDFLCSPVDHLEFQTRVRNLLRLGCHQRLARDRALMLERELKESERSLDQVLRESRERLAQVIDTVPAMISAVDRDGNCIFVNAYQTALIGERHHMQARSEETARLDRFITESGISMPSFEETIPDRQGNVRTFITSKSPLRDTDGAVGGVLTTSLEITERKRAEAQLLFQARHDHLTTLPNRGFLCDRIENQLSPDASGERFALHFIDLDRFKFINDGLGHHFGDKVLQAVAERLRSATRGSDVVARLGGDEFAVLQMGASSAEAGRLAKRINHLLLRPLLIEGHEIGCTASIGVTLYPRDGNSVEELLQNADLAMYRVKSAGRNGHVFFAEEMMSQAREAIWLTDSVRRAVAQREFVLHYQPQVSLLTGDVVGVEALLRWPRSMATGVSTTELLRVAEETSLMAEIDEWVLIEACRQAKRWQDTLHRCIRVSVNLSPLQFHSSAFGRMLDRAMERTGVSPDVLEFEITERMLIEEAEYSSSAIKEIRRRGIRLSIDDFGTGFSSLARLSNLRFDRLKFDQSFVSQLDQSNNMAVIRAVISLCRALDVEVLAEGVENETQLKRLAEAGCTLAQGYHCGRPMSPDEFEQFLERGDATQMLCQVG